MLAPDPNEPTRRHWKLGAVVAAALVAATATIGLVTRDDGTSRDAAASPAIVGDSRQPGSGRPESAAADPDVAGGEVVSASDGQTVVDNPSAATARPEPVPVDPPPAPDHDAGDDEAVVAAAQDSEVPLTADLLTGYWTNVGGRTSGWTALFADFRRDGTFTLGNTGSLAEGAYTRGTYAVAGDVIEFTETGDGCEGEGFRWTTTRVTDGSLDVDVSGGCVPDDGWNWSWVRVSPMSTAGTELEAGSSGAAPQVPETANGIYGIWYRLDTGDVVSIRADGSYLFSSAGDTLAPDDAGQVEFVAPGVVEFTSDGSGACASGDTWTWTEVTTAPDLVREGNPRGTTMRTSSSDLCGSVGGPPVWRLLSPDLVVGR